MNILFLTLFSINAILCLIIIGFIDTYNQTIYKKWGFIISKSIITIKENHFITNIGKKIQKEDTTIKIISENQLLFYSDTKSIIMGIITRKIVPNIIFGDCNIIDNSVTINYKIPIFFIPLIITCIAYVIYDYIKSLFILTPIPIFILCFIGISTFIQYIKLKNIKYDIEYYVQDEK